GSGFFELLGAIRYQPVKNFYINARAMYYQHSTDTANINFGGNIFRDYDSRASNYGVNLINGVRSQCALAGLTLSYELKENLFVDAGATYRKKVYDGAVYPAEDALWFTGGLRLNIVQREYNFY